MDNGNDLTGQMVDRTLEANRLRRGLCLVPADAVAWTALGKELGRQGRNLEAVGNHVRSGIAAPSYAKPRQRLASLLRLNDPEIADRFGRLLARWLGPADAGAHLLEALEARRGGDVRAACGYLRRAAVLDPSWGRLWSEYAATRRFALGDPKAGRQWRLARAADPTGAVLPDLSDATLPPDVATRQLLGHLMQNARDGAARGALIAFAGAERHRRSASICHQVDRPLVLISQIQRSGGSMLLQMLDGHPDLLAYPYELILGLKSKSDWPDFDLSAAPADWLLELLDIRLPRLVLEGYVKADHNVHAAARHIPFRLDILGLVRRFLQIAHSPATSQRQILHWYFSAYFDAWRDLRRSGEESYVVGFRPRVSMHPLSIARFRRDYFDGWLVGCIRHPRSWLISAARHHSAYRDHGMALTLWRLSAEAVLDQLQRYPRTCLMVYERVVCDPEREMRRLAAAIGIDWHPAMLVPTFRGRRLRPNSSFAMAGTGIRRESLSREAMLPESVERHIAEHALPVYEAACRIADSLADDMASCSR